jgi:AcrR family transcriptional regulator
VSAVTDSDLVPADRVEQVLHRAARLFTSKGYEAASMRDLAAAVDIRPSSLYHHFRSKQHILFEICSGFQRDFNLEVVPELRAERPADAAIRAAIKKHIEFSHRRWPDVLVNLRERRSLPAEQQATLNVLRRQYRDAMAAAIQRGITDGVFAVPDSKLAAMMILDMVNGIAYWFKPRDRRDLERMAERYGDAAGAMLRSEVPPPGPKPAE